MDLNKVAKFLLVIFVKELFCTEIYLSPKGRDHGNCGSFQDQCKSLNYTLIQRAQIAENISIYLDGGQTEKNSYTLFDDLPWSGSLHLQKQNDSTYDPVIRANDTSRSTRLTFENEPTKAKMKFFVDSVRFEYLNVFIQSNVDFIMRNSEISTSDDNDFLRIENIFGMRVSFDSCVITSESGKFISYTNQNDNTTAANLSITNSIIGATIHVSGAILLRIENTTFQGMRAQYPPLSLINASLAMVNNCTFKNNILKGRTPVVKIYNSTALFKSTLFLDNMGYNLLHLEGSKTDFKNCLFKSNNHTGSVIEAIEPMVEITKDIKRELCHSCLNGYPAKVILQLCETHTACLRNPSQISIKLSNCVFNSNNGRNVIAADDTKTIELTASEIVNNTISSSIFRLRQIVLSKNIDTFSLHELLFENNTAGKIIEHNGWTSVISISSTVFSNNKIGTGMDLRVKLNMANTLFDRNTFGHSMIKTFFKNVTITNCTMSDNRFGPDAMMQCLYNQKLVIVSTKFLGNNLISSLISLLRTNIVIKNTIFGNNTVWNILVAIGSHATIEATTVVSNTAEDALISLWTHDPSYTSSINSSNNKFDGNHAKRAVIDCFSTTTNIKNNTVENNTFQSFVSLTECNASISSLVLRKNIANGLGKVVHFNEKNAKEKRLSLSDIDSSFEGKRSDDESNSPVLHIQIQKGALMMKNVSIVLTGDYSTGMSTAVYLSLDIQNLKKSHPEATLHCPKNYNPATSTTASNIFFEYELSCQACRRGLYNVRSGSQVIKGTTTESRSTPFLFDWITRTVIKEIKIIKTNSHRCQLCPAGGNCINQIKSRDNFYGYVNDEFKVNFVSCPDNYCCSKRGRECKSYNTCDFNRTGILCGSCNKGYYVNFFSNNCVPSFKCTSRDQVVFWILYLLSAVVVSLFLCFTKDITTFLKNICKETWKHFLPRRLKKRTLVYINKALETEFQIIPRTVLPTSQSRGVQTTETKPDFPFSAIFNILVGFYQIKALITIQLDSSKTSYLSIISGFFNLEIVTKNFEFMCPIPTMTVVFRDFLKGYVMTAVMLLTILVALVVVKIVKLVKKSNVALSIAQTFSIGYLIIMSFSYKNLSKLAFTFIHCVTIDNSSVLYISGDTECYTGWQIANFLFLILWVVPFPLAATAAYNLHKQKRINTRMFMICLTFPIVTPFLHLKKEKPKDCEEKEVRKRLYETFEAPYRVNMFWWESWRLYERFVLSGITTYLTNPAIRLCFLTPVMFAFLLLQHYVNPYKKSLKILSWLDLSSNVCLCLLLVINMFRADVYVHSIPLQYPVDLIISTTNYFEEIFSPLWLLFIYLLVGQIGKAIVKRNKKAKSKFV